MCRFVGPAELFQSCTAQRGICSYIRIIFICRDRFDVMSVFVIGNDSVLFSFVFFLRRCFFIKRKCEIIFNDPGGIPPEGLVLVVDSFSRIADFFILLYDQMGEIQFSSFFLSKPFSSNSDSDSFISAEVSGMFSRISAAFFPISGEDMLLSVP